MSNSNIGGALVTVFWGVTIILTIGAGFLSWSLIEPDSFFGIIGFLILWGIGSKVAHLLAIGLVTLISRID